MWALQCGKFGPKKPVGHLKRLVVKAICHTINTIDDYKWYREIRKNKKLAKKNLIFFKVLFELLLLCCIFLFKVFFVVPANVFAGDSFKRRVCRHWLSHFMWLLLLQPCMLGVRNLRLQFMRLVSSVGIHTSLIWALALLGIFWTFYFWRVVLGI